MKRQALKRYLFIGLAAGLALGGCSKDSGSDDPYGGNTPNPGGGNTVSIGSSSFGPSPLTVKAGTTVTWTNNDSYAVHTVTSDDGKFDSGNMNTGGKFSYKFDQTGTYKYHCSYHPMSGTVIVN